MSTTTIQREMSISNIFIREASRRDLKILVSLLMELNNLHRKQFKSRLRYYKPKRISLYFKQVIRKYDDSICFVAVIDNNVVGLITVVKDISWDDVPSLKIRDFVIQREFRSIGIGSMLFEKVHELAQEMNIDTISVEVHMYNKDAGRFYDRRGFSMQGICINTSACLLELKLSSATLPEEQRSFVATTDRIQEGLDAYDQ